MIGEGLHFDQHEIGAVFRTLGRTVSETDIVSFVNLCGFTEPLFMDMEYVARESLFKRRAAPGALTFALSEGLIMTSNHAPLIWLTVSPCANAWAKLTTAVRVASSARRSPRPYTA